MPIKYSKEEALRQLTEGLKDLSHLYNVACVNWTGSAPEGDLYGEIVAADLLAMNIEDLMNKGIEVINRGNYRVATHDAKTHVQTNRREEIYAKKLLEDKAELPILGRIFDYQVPLKAKMSDKAGKIDLVSYNPGTNLCHIIELKHGDNKESLLRAVLEIATYYRQLNKANFLCSFKELADVVPENIKIALLLSKGTNAYAEAQQLAQRPRLKELISKLQIIIGLLDDPERPSEIAVI